MSLLVIGLNHTTAPVSVRERLAFAPEHLPDELQRACELPGIGESVILSTCNRTELILAAADAEAESAAVDWLAATRHLARAEFEASLYLHREDAALHHLIAVASGLDSMVMGEPQILGQFKSALVSARRAGTVGAELGRALEHVLVVAKRIRTETAIGQSPISVAYAAVRLARHIFDDFSRATALLIGAGEMIELVARHLRDAGVPELIIANRTLERGEQLAGRVGGEAILLGQIPEYLPRADIVISSTASQLPILGKGSVEQALRARRRKPMFMVDIAVPRDIEPQVAELDNVYLYTVDDLEQIIDDNRRAREQEAWRAAAIIAEGVEAWHRNRRSLDAVGVLRDYREQSERLRDHEVERALRALRAGGDPEQVLAQLGRGLTNKLVHAPCVQLRRAGAEGRQDLLVWSRRLLGVDGEDTGGEP
jgi:glutamyl-tRNA reductase